MKFKILSFLFVFFFFACYCYSKPVVTLSEMNNELDFLNYSKSAAIAKKIRKKAKVGSDEWLQATFALAVSLHQRQPDVKSEKLHAEKLYNEVIKNSAGKKIKAKAMILLARMASERDYLNDKPEKLKSKQLYSEVIKEFPNTKLADMAALFKAQLDIFSTDKEDVAKGISFTLDWLKKRPTNIFASLQYSLLADTYYRRFNDSRKSVEYSLKAEKAGLPQPRLTQELIVQEIFTFILMVTGRISNFF